MTEDTTPSTVDENGYLLDSLPELNYGGRDCHIFIGSYMDAFAADFRAESETGSAVNDAVYNARRSVEERLGIKISMRCSTGSDMTEMFDLLRDVQTIQFGDVFMSNLSLHVDTFKAAYDVGTYTTTLASNKVKNQEQPDTLVAALRNIENQK